MSEKVKKLIGYQITYLNENDTSKSFVISYDSKIYQIEIDEGILYIYLLEYKDERGNNLLKSVIKEWLDFHYLYEGDEEELNDCTVVNEDE